jgi:transposase-like protein
MEPKSLQEAILYFAKPENCREYMVARRWPDGVTCPRCQSQNVIFLEKYNRWHCREKHSAPQFTLKTGTIFEDSPIGLDKWLTAMWLIVNCKNGVSSWEIHRSLKITQKTAWFMLHRIRLALRNADSAKMGGEGSEIEVDETYMGGKVKNMHKEKRTRYRAMSKTSHLAGVTGKTAVIGVLDRTAREIRTQVVPNVARLALQNIVLNTVERGTNVYTDSHAGYRNLGDTFVHEFVNHAEKYVEGRVHTNGLENFWSLLKRHINGTYVCVEPFHLERYLDEQVFRFNNRATKDNPLNDSDRFDAAIRQIVGKRLTYSELTGKERQEAF